MAEQFATKSLDDIVPSVRPRFEELLEIAEQLGMQPEIRSAGRTCAQQQEQVRMGHSGANLCLSWHVVGHALDLNLKPASCSTYTKLGEVWESMGGWWGGRWTQYGACGDAGHFHYGLPEDPNRGAPPPELCKARGLRECAEDRAAYYADEIESARRAQRAKMLRSLALGGLVAGALGLVVYYYVQR